MQILTRPSKIYPKFEFFKIQDGGRQPSWKYTKRHNFAKYWPICTKFGTHFVFLILKMCQILTGSKFNMAAAAILDFGFIAISRPPIIRFWPNLVCRRRFWLRPRKFIQNLNFSKFKMADESHLENIRNVITSHNIDRFAQNLLCGRILSSYNLENVSKCKPEVNSTWRRRPYWIKLFWSYLRHRMR